MAGRGDAPGALSRPPSERPAPMSQNTPSPTTPPLFDPASVVAREYEPAAVIALALWCMIGTVMMFAGTALLDTSGLALTVAETALLLIIDRQGFYTAAGLFKVDQWSKAQRVLLAIAEIPLFFVVLAVYIIRIGMLTFSRLPSADHRP